MFEVKLKGNDVVDRSGAGPRGPERPRVSATLPNGEVLVIPTAEMSRRQDERNLGESSARPDPE